MVHDFGLRRPTARTRQDAEVGSGQFLTATYFLGQFLKTTLKIRLLGHVGGSVS